MSRLLIAFQPCLIRLAIRTILEVRADLQVTGEASTGDEVLELVERQRPEIVLMDYWLPKLPAVEVTRRIAAGDYATRVLILSFHGSHEHAADVLRAGAAGYLPETSSAEELFTAIDVVRRGESYLPPAIAHRVLQALTRAPEASGSPLSRLTAREREVFQRIAEGSSTRELAGELGVSVRTAESHRAAIMRKLELGGITELVRLAIREGLIAA